MILRPPRDPHFDEALAFAALQPRAVIVCDLIASLDRANRVLADTGRVTITLRGPYSNDVLRETFHQFKSMTEGYFLLSKALFCSGGFRFEEPASIVVLGDVSPWTKQVLLGRWRPCRNDLPHFIKVKE